MNDPDTDLPADTGGTDITRFNALRHGVLSRYIVLPWENEDEYRALVASLVAEHAPQGPTEEHLVEELVGVLWRKRRLRMAEGSAHRRGLDGSFESHRKTAKVAITHLSNRIEGDGTAEAVRATDKDTAAASADIDEDEAMTRAALKLLGKSRNDDYEAALSALRADTQEWWEDSLSRDPEDLDDDEHPATADTESLRRFLEREVLPWCAARRKELANRPLIRVQAFGESLDPDKLEKLGRYEVHLDRKLERMLSMLIRLQDLRREPAEA